MHRYIFFLQLVFLFACSNNNLKENIDLTTEVAKPMQVTVLSDLPDSLQPETIVIQKHQVPLTVTIPAKRTSYTIKHKSGPHILNLEPTTISKANFSPVVKNYSAEQGLAQDVTSWSITDSRGNLWFGTHVGGISRYDGHSFTNYTSSHGLVENRINNIMEDKAGILWVSTNSGVNKFNGTTFSNFGNFKDVKHILEDREGNFWFATWNGLYKYAGDSIIQFSESDGLTTKKVTVIDEDKNGTIWVGTDEGLFAYNDHLLQTNNSTEDISAGDVKRFTRIKSIDKNINSLCIDKNNNVWCGTLDGYVKYDGVNTTNYPFASAYFRSAYEDRLGNIWLDGGKDGMSYYDVHSNSIIKVFPNLVSGNTLTEDASGNIWFGTGATGVVKYSGSAFKQISIASIRSVLEDNNGDIWFAGYNAVSRFNGEYFTNYGISTGIWCLFKDKSGSIWMGSADGEGLLKLENNKLTFYSDYNGLINNSPQFITQDSKGNLWIGTEKGISIFNGESFTNFTKKHGLAGDLVSVILEDKTGEFIIGTEGGLSFFDGKSFTNYSPGQTPQGNDIRSLVKDKYGNLWIGTYGGGLHRYDGRSFYTYTTEQGLPDNVATQVALTKEENIIIGTNNGIALLTGFKHVSNAKISGNSSTNKYFPAQNNLSNEELKDYAPVWELYNPKTGYPVMDVNRGQHAIFEDSRGKLWIASGSEKSGLMCFDYSSLYKNKNPPRLNILSVKIDNALICWRNLLDGNKNIEQPKSQLETIVTPPSVTEEVTTFGKPLSDAERAEMRKKFSGIEFDSIHRFYPVPQNLRLPYNHNDITFEFAAIEPDKPLLVQYQYMLEGYDNNWSTPANITSATFGNMNEGTYHFKLKARSPSGVWGEPVIYTFTVLPPWWRTWWAYTIFVMGFLASSVGFIKWRERNLKMEKVKLENIVQIRTAEVVAEKKKSDDLLINILPEEVANELKAKGNAAAKQFGEVTVMFTDFKDFTQITEHLSPTDLVNEIDTCFKAFDNIIGKYNIEKIKTIGDSYMCVGGLPVANTTNAIDMVRAALEIQQFMLEYLQVQKNEGRIVFEMRIGIHTGPVIAGIVGIKKFAYDIWGDTVNIASRMESSGVAGKVNISGTTYELVKDQFTCVYRGKISAKNKGDIDMYFVESVS